LRIVKGVCPNLLKEAGLYRYDQRSGDESPVDDHNHALAALRYLVSRIDRNCMVLGGKRPAPAPEPVKPKNWEDDERYWIPFEDWWYWRRGRAG